MVKVILLGNSGTEPFDAKLQKWLWVFIGSLFIIQASLYYFNDRDSFIDDLMEKVMLFAGMLAFIFAWA